MKVLLVALNAKYVQSNLAVYTLRKAAGSRGIPCEIYESNVNELIENHLTAILDLAPDIVGFSCYIWNIEIVSKLITDLKKLLPETIIVLGGPEVSEIPQKALDKYRADYIVQGAGEKAWVDLLCDFRKKMPPNQRIICRPIALEDTEFPYSKEDNLENRLVYYEASRGCNNRCAYCLSSVNRRLEFRPLDAVFRDIRKLWSLGVRQIKFVDRTFNLDKERTLAFWTHLLENYPDGNFHFEISADRLTDKEMEFLKKVPEGLFQMEIGVQSTYGPTLEAINRRTDTKRLLKRIKELSLLTDVLIYADLIAGLPLESYTRFLKSFSDVIAQRPDRIHLGFLKLLPGTSLRENAEKWGIVYSDYPPYEVLKTKEISFLELAKLKELDWTVDLFYNKEFFKETLNQIEDLSGFFFDLTRRLKEKGRLFRRSKLEANFKFLAGEYPELADFIMFDFLKQGLTKTLPKWYTGDATIEGGENIDLEEVAKNQPVIYLKPSKELQASFGGSTLCLIMGMPHINRKCQKVVVVE